MYIQISSTYLPQFLNILPYVEANPVWICRCACISFQPPGVFRFCFLLNDFSPLSWSLEQASTNTRTEHRRYECCSPIRHNNTKHFLCPINSQHSLERLEMVRWELVPRGSSARAWKLWSCLFSRSDWLSQGLRGCVNESFLGDDYFPYKIILKKKELFQSPACFNCILNLK